MANADVVEPEVTPEAEATPEAGAAAGEEAPQVYDGEPLIEMATKMKEEGNTFMRSKQYTQAVEKYEEGVTMCDKAEGYPMLVREVRALLALKAVLLSNMSQALLSNELYRRALDAATRCLAVDEGNTKALHRRSLAHEALRDWSSAIKDVESLKKLGGGSLTEQDLDNRIAALQDKIAEDLRVRAEYAEKYEDSEPDEMGEMMVRMKNRFDEVCEKYNLRDDPDAAGEVADWLVSGEWNITVDRVAKRWGMEHQDAEDFIMWISQGVEFAKQNAQNAAALDM